MIVPRTVWQDRRYPIAGVVALPNEWRYNTIHWPGTNVNVNDPVGTLRNMQSAWLHQKGYSLGYNFAVFPNGVVYEVRGLDIRCAANGSQPVNKPGVAILLAVPNVNTVPTPAMTKGVQEAVSVTRAHVHRKLIINGHKDVRPDPTACPGDAIYQMIQNGAFEPVDQLPQEPQMVFRTTKTGDKVFSQGDLKTVHWVTGQEGFIAEAITPGWASNAPTIDVPDDVAAWLNSL